ncbi:MAG: hypothetical protein M1837_003556 [Sclerophora amabilis]|nr:MAG: hypothetical protein M1837_003556 [Sclerophora amabilis]
MNPRSTTSQYFRKVLEPGPKKNPLHHRSQSPMANATKNAGGGGGTGSPPRILIIGAGSRGNAYARAITHSTNGRIVAVADPDPFKRRKLGRQYIWGSSGEPKEGQEFEGWREFWEFEVERRRRRTQVGGGDGGGGDDGDYGSVDGVFVCTLDEMHAEIIMALAGLEGLHIMSEKPLATRLEDCLDIYKALLRGGVRADGANKAIFSIGHVLRYSPHNMLLRKLLLVDEVVGEIVSVEHTEPVGWWHFSHSYVRGNWRKESVTAPSLLTKSCHDVDLLLWLLCSPPPNSKRPPHLPSTVASTGNLVHFKRSRKPALAADATNCLSCPAEPDCQYSAKDIYHETLLSGKTGWPVKIVAPEIEDCLKKYDMGAAEKVLLKKLAEDYDDSMSEEETNARPWFGRCVYEANNDVCDDQVVTMTWQDDPNTDGLPASLDGAINDIGDRALKGRGAKTAIMHMIAFTEKICERRSRIYGTKGEVEADSTTIKVHNFASAQTDTYHPHRAQGGHGGGDGGLARQFVSAIDAVKNRGARVEEAQSEYIGCTVEEVIRSHAMVFAAEEARTEQKVLNWSEWWERAVESQLRETMTQTMFETYSNREDLDGIQSFE